MSSRRVSILGRESGSGDKVCERKSHAHFNDIIAGSVFFPEVYWGYATRISIYVHIFCCIDHDIMQNMNWEPSISQSWTYLRRGLLCIPKAMGVLPRRSEPGWWMNAREVSFIAKDAWLSSHNCQPSWHRWCLQKDGFLKPTNPGWKLNMCPKQAVFWTLGHLALVPHSFIKTFWPLEIWTGRKFV